MKITITVEQEIEVPDDRLLELAQASRDKWHRDDLASVHAEDLLIEADVRGLATPALPEHYRAEDVEFTDDDLRELAKPKKKRRTKR